jgi:pimeloyl-ACP methyl ester carboxylesterase
MPHTESIRRFRVGSDWIEYDDSGDGEPILLVHAGVFSDWFAPVAAESALREFRLIRVRRAGYVAGPAPTGHLTLADHARHCAMLLDDLGIGAAHVCGHSSSALIGLQLALDRPELVHSLVLLDPAPGGDLLGPINAPVIPNVVGPAMAAYAGGDVATGFERFMNAVCGPHHRSVMRDVLGADGYDRAVRESAFFPDEVAAVGEWRFGPADAARIGVPTLLVDGERTAEVAAVRPESVTRLAAMMPHADVVVLPGVSHLMPLEDSRGVARLIADFVSANPIGGS